MIELPGGSSQAHGSHVGREQTVASVRSSTAQRRLESDRCIRWLSFEKFSQDILTSTGDYAYLGDVSGEITSISVSSPSPVPEPLIISLFALGFVAVGAIGRRERRRSAAPN